MQILLLNAYEAWRSAIQYHDKIKNGFVTLQYQKGFVSALHNAVELFLKQMMLDNNEYGVVQVRNLDKNSKKKQEKIDLMRDYLNASDLNVFFTDLKENKPELFKHFYSIEFSALIDYAEELTENVNMKHDLNLLKDLRINEVHFYFDEDFLREDEFCRLHNFMADFYDVLLEKQYIGNITFNTTNSKISVLTTEHQFMKFTFEKWNCFSYREAVKRNPLIKIIATELSQTGFESEQKHEENFHLFWIAELIIEKSDITENYNEIFAFLVAMEHQNRFRTICLNLGKPINGFYRYAIEVDLK